MTRHINPDATPPRLELPDDLQKSYRESGDGYLYALLTTAGQILDASSRKARAFMTALPVVQVRAKQSYLRLLDSNGQAPPYLALVTLVPGHPEQIGRAHDCTPV